MSDNAKYRGFGAGLRSARLCFGKGLPALIVGLLISFTAFESARAASQGYPLAEFTASIDNLASLQRGAKYFVNYCLSCHSAKYSRYNRVGRDLGLSDDLVRNNMMFTEQKLGDLMKVAMSKEEAMEWFGAEAPDLTLVARSRGSAWVYTYLKSFYLDDTRPMGVNNAIFQNVAMPHVLWRLQGWQKPVYAENGNGARRIVGFDLVEQGVLSPQEYDKVVRDIVNFLTYLGEPIALKRKNMGINVILFLLILFVLAYFLKREYWRDIH